MTRRRIVFYLISAILIALTYWVPQWMAHRKTIGLPQCNECILNC